VAEILVCGSVAIDVIGKYSGKFSDYEKRYGLSGLNVSLQLASLDFSFGGCGVNITWGLNQLGVDVVPVSVAGANFEDLYRDHLHNNGIDTRYISVDTMYDHCALAVILSDTAGNQLTAFHSGASVSPIRVLPSNIEDIGEIKLALLAPEDAPIMLKQARDLADLAIPFMFDPGQGLAEFTPAQVKELIDLASYIVVNAHEWEILLKLSDQDEQQLLSRVEFAIVTRGSDGSSIYSSGRQEIRVRAVATDSPLDPTGCGDAYRAGFLAGMLRGKDLSTCGNIGSLTATSNLECAQTQQYQFGLDTFCARYRELFGEELNLTGIDAI
jgi:adenosine kinase